MYRPTIGLEIHAELKTRTKMFCDSANDPDETRPNVQVCPICMAHPGTLPTINREAVHHILRIGAAIRGQLADFSEFDRKSYFYPDIPKGYQISQYIHPLVLGGSLADVAITRVHLEEDTARSIHASGKSLVDFNRAGIPLMELVTEPVIPDAQTAGRFARELQLLLRSLGASEANLEKGEMRIEANVSVSNEEKKFGTKVEVKNLNSFRSVERAIAFEIDRQTTLIESGGKVVQETRGWNEAKQETFHQRFKEGSADYRYFPEPDLPKLFLSEIPEFSHESIRASLPELPWERRARFQSYDLQDEIAEILVQNMELGRVFEESVKGRSEKIIKPTASILTSVPVEILPQNPSYLGDLVEMQLDGSLSSTSAKIILPTMFKENRPPKEIAKEMGLIQISNTEDLERIVEKIIKDNEKAVTEYKGGKGATLQYLVGKAMKESGGAGNPESLRKLIKEKLG